MRDCADAGTDEKPTTNMAAAIASFVLMFSFLWGAEVHRDAHLAMGAAVNSAIVFYFANLRRGRESWLRQSIVRMALTIRSTRSKG